MTREHVGGASRHRSAGGRPRDASIDRAVLSAALDELAARGYESMSLVAIARAAGTTRQALYRRWPSKADLATDAIASMRGDDEHVEESDDSYADLVAELDGFRRGVTRPNGISLVGTMLQDSVDPDLVRLYRERVVAPRRRRLRRLLERAIASGDLPADAAGEIDVAVAAATGTMYAMWLAGTPIDEDWALRIATMTWRSLGSEPATKARPR